MAVVRAGSSADLVDPRNAGPAAQLALLLGAGDGFARTAQIVVSLGVLAVTLLAARRGGDPVERLGWAAAASLATLPVDLVPLPVGDDPVRARGPVPRPGHAGRRPRPDR